MHSLYLWINLGTLLFPLLLSFDKKVAFYRQWKYLFPAIAFNAVIFIAWDYYFTTHHIWSFNPRYTIGINILKLPLEEWLFFITVPYACAFIYEVCRIYIGRQIFINTGRKLALSLSVILLFFGFYFRALSYTSLNFILCAIPLLIHGLLLKTRYMGIFWIAFLVQLLPFILVNSILTGSFTDEAIVIYNNAENLKIRIFTIPAEDIIYSLLLMLIPVTLLEQFRKGALKTQDLSSRTHNRHG